MAERPLPARLGMEPACAARVSDDARPGVLVAPMGWWNADYPEGRSGQATTSQALTERGHAPIFNDNRVEVELTR